MYRNSLEHASDKMAVNVFKQLYLRITTTKLHKAGTVAVMHKMLIIARSMVKKTTQKGKINCSKMKPKT